MHRMKADRATVSRLGFASACLAAIVAMALAPDCTAAPATQPAAKDDNPHVWKSKVTSVAVFKNGLGFFMREGDVELRDGWALAKEVPPALFGTLAIFAHDKDQTVDIVGAGPGETVEFDGVDAAKDLDAKRQRIAAYTDLGVQLTYKSAATTRTAAGKVKSAEGKYAILESDANTFAVPLEDVTKLQVLDLPIRAHRRKHVDL